MRIYSGIQFMIECSINSWETPCCCPLIFSRSCLMWCQWRVYPMSYFIYLPTWDIFTLEFMVEEYSYFIVWMHCYHLAIPSCYPTTITWFVHCDGYRNIQPLKLLMFYLPMLASLCFFNLFLCKIPMHRKWIGRASCRERVYVLV